MPIVDFIHRIGGAVAGAAAKLLKFRRILVLDPEHFDTEDQPTATIQGTSSNPGTGTGYTRVRIREGVLEASSANEQVLFATIEDTTQVNPQTRGARVVDAPTNQPWATSATFVAGIARNSGAGPVHADLYRPGDTTVLATVTTTSATGEELTADVSAEIIGQPSAILFVRVYADVDTLINALFSALNAHFANDSAHDGTDSANILSAVTYPPAIDSATRIARINAECDAYEAHRVLGSGDSIHINVGGDTTNVLAIVTDATTDEEAQARAIDLQTAFNAHIADGSTWHNETDLGNNVPAPGNCGIFYASIRYS